MFSSEDFMAMENQVIQEALTILTLALESSLYHQNQTGHEQYCPWVGTTAAENFLYLMAFHPDVQFVNPWHTFKERRSDWCFGDCSSGGYNYSHDAFCTVYEPMTEAQLQDVEKRTWELGKLWNRKHYAVISDLWAAAGREARFKLVAGEDSVRPIVPKVDGDAEESPDFDGGVDANDDTQPDAGDLFPMGDALM